MYLDRYHNQESFLRHFQDRTGVLEVFEHFFPSEFQALGVTSVSPIADRIQAYEALVDLLKDKMPLYIFDWECIGQSQIEVEDEFIQYIPLDPQGMDFWDMNLDYVPFAYRVILSICQQEDYDGDHVVNAMVKHSIPRERIDTDSLLDTCFKSSAVPNGLYDTFMMVFCSTGNTWLDISQELYDNSERPEWAIQNVQYLIEGWRDAQLIIARANEFSDWLEADTRRIREVEKMLQKATRPRQRVRIGGPQPLIQTLTGSLLTDFDEGFDYEEI